MSASVIAGRDTLPVFEFSEHAFDLVALAVECFAVRMLGFPDGKYAGRVVARVQMPGGGDLLDAFLRAGLGRGYQGRQRESWCQALAA